MVYISARSQIKLQLRLCQKPAIIDKRKTTEDSETYNLQNLFTSYGGEESFKMFNDYYWNGTVFIFQVHRL